MGKVTDLRAELPDASDLLVELATIDEIEAVIPTTGDHMEGTVPQWCELVLEVKRERTDDQHGIAQRWHLRRHDGELINEVIREVLHPHMGLSIIEGLWLELDAVMDRLMNDPKKMDKGIATGLTLAIARMRNPYHPDTDAIKAEAVERFEARHAS